MCLLETLCGHTDVGVGNAYMTLLRDHMVENVSFFSIRPIEQ